MQCFAPPFERFIAPARSKAELWRTGVGSCLILAIYAGLGLAAFRVAQWVWRSPDIEGRDPGSLLFLLTTVAALAFGTGIVVRVLHRRSVRSLFGRAAWVLRDFVLAVVVAAPLFTLLVALWLIWFSPTTGLAPDQWLRLLPVALCAVAIQTGAEEMVFRGYLQQQLAARFASPLAWMIVPSVLFGYAHFSGDLPMTAGLLLVGAAAVFGLIAADLTARSGTIGAAWGLHFVNNVLALLLLATAGPMDGLALARTPYGLETPFLPWLILADLTGLGLAWLTLRRLILR